MCEHEKTLGRVGPHTLCDDVDLVETEQVVHAKMLMRARAILNMIGCLAQI